MKTVIKILVLCFAAFGIAMSVLLILDYRNNDKMARAYLENCPKIKIGMSLNLARIELGEFDDDYFFLHKEQPRFEYNLIDSLPARYFLVYPYVND